METPLSRDHPCNTIPMHTAASVRVWREACLYAALEGVRSTPQDECHCLEGVCLCVTWLLNKGWLLCLSPFIETEVGEEVIDGKKGKI